MGLITLREGLGPEWTVNNGIFAAMLAGVGGVMSGWTPESGVARVSAPKSPLVEVVAEVRRCTSDPTPDFSFSGCLSATSSCRI